MKKNILYNYIRRFDKFKSKFPIDFVYRIDIYEYTNRYYYCEMLYKVFLKHLNFIVQKKEYESAKYSKIILVFLSFLI